MSLKKNVIANYLGQGWTALMGLAFVPLYIKYLGIEAYGLIGLFAILTAWLSLLDMGMTPVLGREMARFTGGGHTPESIRDLLRSIELVAIVIAGIIAGGMTLGADWLAGSWLKAEKLPVPVVAQAFAIMGMVTAMRFVEGLYRSCIIGLQRQVLFNVVNSAMATLRGLGSVGILVWLSPTIFAFFLWQGVVSVVTVALLAAITYDKLPKIERTAQFSPDSLRMVWKFAGGMMLTTFLSLLLTQVDKIILSRLLTLSEYGYYTLATVVAGALFVLITPITQAWYPRLCEYKVHENHVALVDAFHKGSQLVSVGAGSIAIVLIMFSETVLLLWTHDSELAKNVAPLLSLLVLGNLCNGLMHIPYQTQLAFGWTSLTAKINIFAVLMIVPAIYWITPLYGAKGAAWIWVLLNIGYVIVGMSLMFRYILSGEKVKWYLDDVILPLAMAFLVAWAVKMSWPHGNAISLLVLQLAVAMSLVFGMSLLAAKSLRNQAFGNVKFLNKLL